MSPPAGEPHGEPSDEPLDDLRGVDTHLHLDDAAFDRDREAVVAAASRVGIVQLINVGYRPARWDSSAALTDGNPAISHMLGVHPQHADELTEENLRRLRRRIDESSAVAVGEIGLDYFRAGFDRAVQRRAFERQIDLALELGLPIVIHQRAAEADVVDVLTSYDTLPKVVLHSFEGSARFARLAVERGFFIGVGGLATRPASGPLRTVLASVPVSLLVLETDAPYLSPVRASNRRNEPKNVRLVAECLAPIWSLTPGELVRATGETARRVFDLATPSSSVRGAES